MKGKTKALLTGAIWGFIITTVGEIIRYSVGHRDFSEIGWAIFTIVFFTITASLISAWAYGAGAGIYSSRRRDASTNSHQEVSRLTDTEVS